MKTSQDKVLEAIAGLLPESERGKVVDAVTAFLTEAEGAIKSEYEKKAEEAFSQADAKVVEAEKVAEQGYAEAYEVIVDLKDRLQTQKEEYEQQLEEGYEEAYQMLQAERTKNDTLEVDLYEEYDGRLGEIKEFLIDKLDQFMATKGEEFYAHAKKDVLADPTVAEHKVALDRILEAAIPYLTDEDFTFASSTRLQELERGQSELRGQVKILEARNMRLQTENTKLNEVARQAQEVLTEGAKVEKKARKEAAAKVESRSQREVETVAVIAEQTAAEPAAKTNDQAEKTDGNLFTEWQRLAGVKTAK